MEKVKFLGENIDPTVIEEQEEKLKRINEQKNANKINFDTKNYLDLTLKEHETTKTVKVRFLPISATSNKVFFDVMTHSLKVDKNVAKSGFKSFICLNDENVKSEVECPICKRIKELYNKEDQLKKEGNDVLAKSIHKEASSMRKRRTFITRVIDRDHEDEGVKFWRFNDNSKGEGIYDKLLALYKTRRDESIEDEECQYLKVYYDEKSGKNVTEEVTKEEYELLPEENRKINGYNIFDLYEGKDIVINAVKSKIPDGFGGMKDSISYNITDSGNKKPLSKDVEKANSWLNDPKTWEDVYTVKSPDYIELVMDNKVPIFNKELGKYVEKTEFDSEVKKMEDEAASEILKGDYVHSAANTNVANTSDPDDGDDLPF